MKKNQQLFTQCIVVTTYHFYTIFKTEGWTTQKTNDYAVVSPLFLQLGLNKHTRTTPFVVNFALLSHRCHRVSTNTSSM